MNKKQILHVQQKILSWYEKHGRHDLPWRKTTDVYAIVIAEMMLQQTNVPKVITKFTAFLTRFPTVADVASAAQKDVVIAWQGLGYNRRALYVHNMAKEVVARYGGVFPTTAEELMTLPGIGPYTGRSILIFAHNADIVTWDVNIRRIFERIHQKHAVSDALLQQWCDDFLPHKRSRDWHNALMDFASHVCTKRAPQCKECPLQSVCASYPQPAVYATPKKKEVGRTECGVHVPQRIFRGRIVEHLRNHHSATCDEIGRAIKKDYHAKRDHAWCRGVLLKLTKEGILVCKRDTWLLR